MSLINQNNVILQQLSQQANMLQYLSGQAISASPTMYLDNCTDVAQIPSPLRGDLQMAKHRLRICIGYNDDHSPIIKQISANSELELADKAAHTILDSERRKEFISEPTENKGTSVPCFKEFSEKWLNTFKTRKIKSTILAGYRAILNSHLYPTWGDTPINQIRVDNIQSFLNDRESLSKKYLTEMRNLLSQIFDYAVSSEYISRNPARESILTIPSNKASERKPLELSELKKIIDTLDNLDGQDRYYAALLIFTGMRRGEILGLRWEDIDIANNVIHVQRNATYAKNQAKIDDPKTEKGKRDVPIMPELLKYLLPKQDSGYIFCSGDKPISLTQFRNMFSRLEKKLPLNEHTSHSFRHTMGTLLNDAGANFKTTMDRYVHPVDSKKQAAIVSVSDILNNTNTKQAV